jgi:hypothetical protein
MGRSGAWRVSCGSRYGRRGGVGEARVRRNGGAAAAASGEWSAGDTALGLQAEVDRRLGQVGRRYWLRTRAELS